jgi:hypothetical protein
MLNCRKPAHVGADFGNQRLCDIAADAWNRVQAGNNCLPWTHAIGDLDADVVDRSIDSLNLLQLLANEEALMGFYPTDQGLLQLWDLLAHTALCQFSHPTGYITPPSRIARSRPVDTNKLLSVRRHYGLPYPLVGGTR